MAPLPNLFDIFSGLGLSTARLARRATPSSSLRNDLSETHNVLARAESSTQNFPHGSGSANPHNFSGAGFIALFAILAGGMVLASLWFFFWAKNGGFHFREGDWEDYKSTVLRRKGPDGRTLSNATRSTKLGGASIAGTQHYQWQKQYARSVVGRDEKGRKGIRAKRGWGNTHSITYDDDRDYMTETFGTRTVGDMTEIREENETREGPEYTQHSNRYRDRDVQQYKREKPARVGGLNRVADGSDFYGTNSERSDAMTEASDRPMLPKVHDHDAKERAERKAREEAARMERRWRKDAEEAAAALAREDARYEAPRRSAPPAAKPSVQKQRSESPKKRDFSYNTGPASEILSTTYSASTDQRTASSYYDAYRPHGPAEPARVTQKKPTQGGGRRGAPGGYRRGADDDFD